MHEARAIIRSYEDTKAAIESIDAVNKSDYAFRDIIFRDKKQSDIIRIRIYTKSNWQTKAVALVRKKTEFEGAIQTNKTLLKIEFDDIQEALELMNKKFGSYRKELEYSRKGSEYALDGTRIFVEDIEGWQPSIEIEAASKTEIENVFSSIKIVKRLHESVPEIMRKLKTDLKTGKIN